MSSSSLPFSSSAHRKEGIALPTDGRIKDRKINGKISVRLFSRRRRTKKYGKIDFTEFASFFFIRAPNGCGQPGQCPSTHTHTHTHTRLRIKPTLVILNPAHIRQMADRHAMNIEKRQKVSFFISMRPNRILGRVQIIDRAGHVQKPMVLWHLINLVFLQQLI